MPVGIGVLSNVPTTVYCCSPPLLSSIGTGVTDLPAACAFGGVLVGHQLARAERAQLALDRSPWRTCRRRPRSLSMAASRRTLFGWPSTFASIVTNNVPARSTPGSARDLVHRLGTKPDLAGRRAPASGWSGR